MDRLFPAIIALLRATPYPSTITDARSPNGDLLSGVFRAIHPILPQLRLEEITVHGYDLAPGQRAWQLEPPQAVGASTCSVAVFALCMGDRYWWSEGQCTLVDIIDHNRQQLAEFVAEDELSCGFMDHAIAPASPEHSLRPTQELLAWECQFRAEFQAWLLATRTPSAPPRGTGMRL